MNIRSIIREEKLFVEYQGVSYVREAKFISTTKVTKIEWRQQRGWSSVSPKMAKKLEEIFLSNKEVKSKIRKNHLA